MLFGVEPTYSEVVRTRDGRLSAWGAFLDCPRDAAGWVAALAVIMNVARDSQNRRGAPGLYRLWSLPPEATPYILPNRYAVAVCREPDQFNGFPDLEHAEYLRETGRESVGFLCLTDDTQLHQIDDEGVSGPIAGLTGCLVARPVTPSQEGHLLSDRHVGAITMLVDDGSFPWADSIDAPETCPQPVIARLHQLNTRFG